MPKAASTSCAYILKVGGYGLDMMLVRTCTFGLDFASRPTWRSASPSRSSRSPPRCSPTRRSAKAAPTASSPPLADLDRHRQRRSGMPFFVFEVTASASERYVDSRARRAGCVLRSAATAYRISTSRSRRPVLSRDATHWRPPAPLALLGEADALRPGHDPPTTILPECGWKKYYRDAGPAAPGKASASAPRALWAGLLTTSPALGRGLGSRADDTGPGKSAWRFAPRRAGARPRHALPRRIGASTTPTTLLNRLSQASVAARPAASAAGAPGGRGYPYAAPHRRQHGDSAPTRCSSSAPGGRATSAASSPTIAPLARAAATVCLPRGAHASTWQRHPVSPLYCTAQLAGRRPHARSGFCRSARAADRGDRRSFWLLSALSGGRRTCPILGLNRRDPRHPRTRRHGTRRRRARSPAAKHVRAPVGSSGVGRSRRSRLRAQIRSSPTIPPIAAQAAGRSSLGEAG